MTDTEKDPIIITDVAIRFKDKIYSLPKPWRHYHIQILIGGIYGVDTQGFLTNEGKFVNRAEAKKIAIESWQIIPPVNEEKALYSEDVWQTNWIGQYTDLLVSKAGPETCYLTAPLLIPSIYASVVRKIMQDTDDLDDTREVLFTLLTYLVKARECWPMTVMVLEQLKELFPEKQFVCIQ